MSMLPTIAMPSSRRITSIAWILVGAALCIGFVTRIAALSHYIDFAYDQIRDAYVLSGIWSGTLPVLGPRIMDGSFCLPPLYYYLILPITLLGFNPALQSLPNAIFSFLTIPLLIFAIYRLLEGKSHSVRLFWAAIGGLWWSGMATDINLATREWNPSSIPFFLLSFTLIAAAQLESPVVTRLSVIAWIGLGGILAVLMSLHASTLYVTSLVFVVVAVAFIVRARSRVQAIGLVLLAFGVMVLCLTPYWQGEIRDSWQNSRAMVAYVGAFSQKTSLEQRVVNAVRAYEWLDGQGYFLGENVLLRQGGLVFLYSILIASVLTFRGNRSLSLVLACTWLIFLCAASVYPAMEIRYRLPIATAPIFLTVSALAFLNYRSMYGRILGALYVFGVLVSIVSNVVMDVQHQASAFGPSRLVATSDLISAFNHIPYGSSVCVNPSDFYTIPSLRYIDIYVTRRNLQFSDRCTPETYAIRPKFVGVVSGSDFATDWGNQTLSYIKHTNPIPSPPLPPNASLVEEMDALSIVKWR